MNSAASPVFFGLAVVLTLVWLSRELPLQSVVTVMLIMAALGAAGCFVREENCWWLPLIVLNSRGAARCALYRWHQRAYCGWWVIGLTCALSSVLALHWSTPVLSLAMQLAALPWLIKRKPNMDIPQFLPLTTWLLFGAFLIFNNRLHL